MGEQIRNGHPGREKKQVIIKKKHRVKFGGVTDIV
jgi:hypothetical protein